jgi:hypothetical protein
LQALKELFLTNELPVDLLDPLAAAYVNNQLNGKVPNTVRETL